MKEGEHRKWADLPPELTSLILQRLGAVKIVEKAEKVCRSWHSVCKDPSMWRKIEMCSLDPCHSRDKSDDVALAIAETMPGLRHLQLFGNKLTEAGLNAILDSCPNLEHLDLRNCYN
ncbi:unnamed protein product [Brassica napus]|uniref:(rape) hypothetical protein n=1 Tax=Brassica napus TaxID=3708 RepID=A0A817BBC7_BRANA|nr:unnamed protein product [Brassica napus]